MVNLKQDSSLLNQTGSNILRQLINKKVKQTSDFFERHLQNINSLVL